MKKYLRLLAVFFCIPTVYYASSVYARDCDSIKDKEDKKICQEDEMEKKLGEVKKHEHKKWDNMDEGEKDWVMDDVMDGRQIH